MSLFHDSALVGASGQGGGYEIERSLRFNSSDSAYLSRTPASAGNRKTWTWSGWVKRAGLGTFQTLLHSGADSENATQLRFNSADTIKFEHQDASVETGTLVTSQVFRDVSAWYHIVLACDTTQATDTNRLKLYVNGTQVTTFSSSTYPSQNADLDINTTTSHRMGGSILSTNYLSGYLADIHFIDGQALTPSSFAETNATTGQWVPKAYSGSYGTNGFQLKFADNSSNTAATLGKDTSGNGNNWTPNNLSVTAGAGNDSLVDTPTSYGTDTGAGGEVRGNYCTWNPLDKDADVTLTNGNLDMTQSAAGGVKGTIHVSSGKWYWEIAIATTVNQVYGIATSAAVPSTYVGGYAGSAGVASAGTLYSSGNFTKVNGATPISGVSPGDTIGFALDLDSSPKTLKFYRNGTLQTGNHFVITETGPLTPVVGTNVADNAAPGSANFGQRPWAFTPPAGHKALCTTNLPEPTIADPSTAMDVVTYTGNGSTQTISGLGFSPDLVWIKKRSGSEWHCINDTVRGAELYLSSNTTNAESGANNVLTAFTSTGYTVGSQGIVNDNGFTFASWCWDAGSSTVTNTQGSITSQVRANATAGFSIVTYTGTGATATVGHGLGTAPYLMIHKARNLADFWLVYHQSLGAGTQLGLSSTSAAAASTKWNNTAPTSTVFTVTNDGAIGQNAINYVTYCFAPVAGYSAFGSYTGNGSSTDGPFIFTGFRTSFVLIKRTDGTSTDYVWWITDSKRGSYNPAANLLQANSANAENSGSLIDLLSNGFKLRNGSGSVNGSGGTFIYAAFAESPFAYSRAR